MKRIHKIISIAAILAVLAALAFNEVYADTKPKVKIIATETANEVQIVIKASGSIEKFAAYSVNVGYKKEKLEYNAASMSMIKPAGWTLDASADKTLYGDSSIGYVTVSNAWYSIGTEGSVIEVTAANDVTLASFAFTKKQAVTAEDIFQQSGGFKFGVAPQQVSYTWLRNDMTDISAKDTTNLVEHSFTAYNPGGSPEPTNPNTSLWVKSLKYSGGTAYTSISGGITAGSYITVMNNQSNPVSVQCVITLYDQNDCLIKKQKLAAVNIAAGAEANVPVTAAIDTAEAKTLKILPYIGTLDPVKPGGLGLTLQ